MRKPLSRFLVILVLAVLLLVCLSILNSHSPIKSSSRSAVKSSHRDHQSMKFRTRTYFQNEIISVGVQEGNIPVEASNKRKTKDPLLNDQSQGQNQDHLANSKVQRLDPNSERITERGAHLESLPHFVTSREVHYKDYDQERTTLISNKTVTARIKHGGRGGRKMFQYVAPGSAPSTQRYNNTGNQTRATYPRVLCWVLTDPNDLEKRTIHVRDTWARRCDVTLFMSSAQNKTFPTIGLNVKPGRNHIAAKAKAAWKYIYQHHLNDADFFLKADPDTYVVVENLKEYLSHERADEPKYYGHRFNPKKWGYTYMSGGPGLILTREAVRRLVTKAFNFQHTCMPDGQGEDYKTAKCLSLVGAAAVDTRDAEGKERFLVFKPSTHLRGHYPDWYIKRDQDGALKGEACCSNYPVSFHYIKPEEMYTLEYFLYHARPHGKERIGL